MLLLEVNWLRKPNKSLKLLLLFTLLTYAYSNDSKMGDTDQELRQDFSSKSGHFANMVYSVLSTLQPNQNIVFSPFSIQTCLAMARVGAEGQTAEEMDRGLSLVSNDIEKMADSFHQVLATYENSDILRIANKIYVMKGYSVQSAFNDILTNKFYTAADEIDFSQNAMAAKTINDWIESKTNNLIKDVVKKDDVNAATRLILLNAIHFKGVWKHQFPKQNTRDDLFYINESDCVKVSMMNIKERFRYADLPELDATALELPYKDTDLSMLVILPNSRTGLSNLEEKLKSYSLLDITQKMYSTQVVVKLPKFKAEFSIELSDAFKKLGMSRMFSGVAEFGKIFESREPINVSKIIHKAFIEVNEEGTEAAAATAVLMMKCAMPMFIESPKKFLADRPFFYAIKNYDNIILFTGIKRN